jgi:glycosyltransferase involved in cell wall biosynthesis
MSTPRPLIIVGQVPPPYGGQAAMIQQLLETNLAPIPMCRVRMFFSSEMDVASRFRLKKLVYLLAVVWRILRARVRVGPADLYYPPSGPNRVPFYRDVFILLFTRWMFVHTVFHFHASGLSELYPRLNRFEQWLFRMAYHKPALGIATSSRNPDDAAFLNADRSVVIEYGIADNYSNYRSAAAERDQHRIPHILFVGLLYKTKGLGILVEACRLLKDRGREFVLTCVGCFESRDFESEIREAIRSAGIEEQVSFPGVLTGPPKWNAYAEADIFCMPSFFESESFGLVNLEAMQFELPVVSTWWRGIPDVVEHGVNGWLVRIMDPVELAGRLEQLILNPCERKEMGQKGRTIYLQRFTEEVWQGRMKQALLAVSLHEP